MKFELYSGAGNRFLLVEDDQGELDASGGARELCARPLFSGLRADGLLVVAHEPDGVARMRIFNADGSRPEACGNGLRCVGWHLARTRGRELVTVRTDVGERQVELRRQAGELAVLYADMGSVTVERLGKPWPQVAGLEDARRADVGNPHCVLRVADERSQELERVGRAMQDHPEYPEGVNVGFLARREGHWRLRVWERGVGETEACGTGACAAAATVGGQDEETAIHMRGGVLTLRRGFGPRYHLLGEARHHGSLALDAGEPASTSRASAVRDPA